MIIDGMQTFGGHNFPNADVTVAASCDDGGGCIQQYRTNIMLQWRFGPYNERNDQGRSD